MDVNILLNAPNPIPVHALLAIFAVVAGAIQFALPKGTGLHRTLGYAWVGSMFVVAVSSFFINEFRWVGPFGPIHLLSVLVLYSLFSGIRSARRHDIASHKKTMSILYFLSLLVAGAFTFMPGRLMYQVLFG